MSEGVERKEDSGGSHYLSVAGSKGVFKRHNFYNDFAIELFIRFEN